VYFIGFEMLEAVVYLILSVCYLKKTLFAGYTQVMIMEGLSRLLPMKENKGY